MLTIYVNKCYEAAPINTVRTHAKRSSSMLVKNWNSILWLLLATACSFCGCGLPDTGDAVFLTGRIVAKDGAPIQNTIFDYTLTATGTDLFTDDSNCATTDSHMAGLIHNTGISTGSDGSYSTTFNSGAFESAGQPNCYSAAQALSQLDSLKIDISVPNSHYNCKAYCHAQQDPANQSSCMNECEKEKRSLLGTRTLSKNELKQLAKARDDGGVSLSDITLTVSQLSIPFSSKHGPDLRVIGSAAQSSVDFEWKLFTPSSCAIAEGCLRSSGYRRVMRFDGTLANMGDEDFILGKPEGNDLFQFSACHGHYHLKEAMRYELLDTKTHKIVEVEGNQVVGRKQGFCLIDVSRVAGFEPSKFNCENQGLTSGWADVYGKYLDCQFIDITGVIPGAYILRITVNPNGTLFETDYTNNSTEVLVDIP